jgi:integrase/recombinase XerD
MIGSTVPRSRDANGYLSDDELARLLRAARERPHRNALRDHALLAILGNCGLRPGEAVKLQREHVHAGARDPWLTVIRLRRPLKPGRWTRRAQPFDRLPLIAPLATLLATYLRRMPADRSARLFPMSVRQVERLFHFYAGRAGLGKGHRVYSLRHTTARRLMRASGNDVAFVQWMLGHTQPHTTASYLHLDPDTTRATVERLGVVL